MLRTVPPLEAPRVTEPSVAPPPAERVVLALGPESREHFLPHFEGATSAAPGCELTHLPSLDPAVWEDFLFARQPTVLITGWGTPPVPARYAASRDLSLRYICHLTGSVRIIVPRLLLERGVVVSNWGTMASVAVAEHAVLLVLAAMRELPRWDRYMQGWVRRDGDAPHLPLDTRRLRGKRVGLHGFGSVARELVQMLRPFRVELSAYSRGVPPELFERHGVARRASLQELFSNCDVLIECEALTPENCGTVDAATLRCLPPGAVFVNVGRGQVVDEAALIQVARENRLRLGLDVFHDEPLPPESGLRALPAALLSPHIAGPAKDEFADLCRFAVANVQRYLRRQPIEAQVSLEVYDRST